MSVCINVCIIKNQPWADTKQISVLHFKTLDWYDKLQAEGEKTEFSVCLIFKTDLLTLLCISHNFVFRHTLLIYTANQGDDYNNGLFFSVHWSWQPHFVMLYFINDKHVWWFATNSMLLCVNTSKIDHSLWPVTLLTTLHSVSKSINGVTFDLHGECDPYVIAQ